MHARSAALAAVSLACAACLPGPGRVHAQPGIDIPASVRAEHQGMLAYLRRIAANPTPKAAAAQKVLDLLLSHMVTEEAIILPPLVLLPALADGRVTPDMRWAITLADRLGAEQTALLHMHEALSDALIALMDAAEAEGDEGTVRFAKDMAADDLGDREVTEPTTLLIGKFLRTRLPPQPPQ